MNIENILKKNKFVYSTKKIKNITIYNVLDEKMIIVIQNRNDNVFTISRDIFNEIDKELLPYSFFLIDNKGGIYFYKVQEPNNTIRTAFDRSNKDIIFFGKEVLNNKINESEIEKCINNIK